jgi:hypothetical protein
MALISSGCGIGVGEGMAVEVCVGVRVAAGVKDWVGGALGDEGDATGLVPAQAEWITDVIPKITINLFMFILLIIMTFSHLAIFCFTGGLR